MQSALAVTIEILDTIIAMSDRAEKLGGATSISGIAALHAMQTSIQKNKPRLERVLNGVR